MNTVLDAALTLTRHYPGGAAALGARMGKTNLADEVNPNLPRSKLGLEDSVTMQLLAGDYRVLYAMAAELRHYPPLPMPEGLDGDMPCLATLAAVAREFAGLMTEVTQDLADGKVTNRELGQALRQWQTLVARGQALMQQLAAMNAALQALAPMGGDDAAAR